MSNHRSAIWEIPRDEMVEIIGNARSLGEVLSAFGLNNKGGNHKTIKARLEQEEIDFSHIPLGRGSNKNRRRGGKAPASLESILV